MPPCSSFQPPQRGDARHHKSPPQRKMGTKAAEPAGGLGHIQANLTPALDEAGGGWSGEVGQDDRHAGTTSEMVHSQQRLSTSALDTKGSLAGVLQGGLSVSSHHRFSGCSIEFIMEQAIFLGKNLSPNIPRLFVRPAAAVVLPFASAL